VRDKGKIGVRNNPFLCEIIPISANLLFAAILLKGEGLYRIH